MFNICMWILQSVFARDETAINSFLLLLFQSKAPHWYIWILNIYRIVSSFLRGKLKSEILHMIICFVSVTSTVLPIGAINAPKSIFSIVLLLMLGVYGTLQLS